MTTKRAAQYRAMQEKSKMSEEDLAIDELWEVLRRRVFGYFGSHKEVTFPFSIQKSLKEQLLVFLSLPDVTLFQECQEVLQNE